MKGLTVGMLTTMWKNVDPNTVVEVSVAGLTGLVVRSASAQDDVAHLDVGTVSEAEIRRALEEAPMPGELFDTDGPVLTVGQLDAVTRVPLTQDVLGRDESGDQTRACVVRARTPHGSHVFDVVSLEWTDDDELMFNLREKA